jgi:MFS transporter, UMF1 family
MGGLSSYCRSFFGLIIPSDREAAFYALYAITDKGSSAVGPAIVGAIVDATGTIRPAFAFLAVLIALPVPLMWMVDAERGRADAIKMAGLSKVAGRDAAGADFHVDDRTQESQGLLDDHEWHSRPMSPSHTTYIINENPEVHVAQSVRMHSETGDFSRE